MSTPHADDLDPGIDTSKFRPHSAWKPGQSGNPSGKRRDGSPRLRPKKLRRRLDVKALAREYGHEAIETLRAIMRGKKHPVSARVSAAQALLDRGYGKPLQTIDITAILGAFDLTRLTDEQLEQWEELIHEAAGPTVDKSGLPAIIEGTLREAVLEPSEGQDEAYSAVEAGESVEIGAVAPDAE